MSKMQIVRQILDDLSSIMYNLNNPREYANSDSKSNADILEEILIAYKSINFDQNIVDKIESFRKKDISKKNISSVIEEFQDIAKKIYQEEKEENLKDFNQDFSDLERHIERLQEQKEGLSPRHKHYQDKNNTYEELITTLQELTDKIKTCRDAYLHSDSDPQDAFRKFQRDLSVITDEGLQNGAIIKHRGNGIILAIQEILKRLSAVFNTKEEKIVTKLSSYGMFTNVTEADNQQQIDMIDIDSSNAFKNDM